MKKLAILAVLMSLAIPGFASDYFQTLNVGNLNVFQKSVLKGPITNTGNFTNVGAMTNTGAFSNTGTFANTGNTTITGTLGVTSNSTLAGNLYIGVDAKKSTYTATTGKMSFYNEVAIPLLTATTLNASGVSTLLGNVVMGDSTHISTYTATTGSLALAGSIVPKQLAKAAILALTPVAVGEIYGCSDCTSVTLCVSTSTTVGEWAKVTDRSALCD